MIKEAGVFPFLKNKFESSEAGVNVFNTFGEEIWKSTFRLKLKQQKEQTILNGFGILIKNDSLTHFCADSDIRSNFCKFLKVGENIFIKLTLILDQHNNTIW